MKEIIEIISIEKSDDFSSLICIDEDGNMDIYVELTNIYLMEKAVGIKESIFRETKEEEDEIYNILSEDNTRYKFRTVSNKLYNILINNDSPFSQNISEDDFRIVKDKNNTHLDDLILLNMNAYINALEEDIDVRKRCKDLIEGKPAKFIINL